MNNVFLFPGYGGQYVGMGKEFYDHYRGVQELFEEASDCLGVNFVKLCFASSERELSKPLNAYLTLFVVHASLFRVLREHDIQPAVITGWGVGYASAHYAAGVLNFPDGLYLLCKYMTFFNELTSGQTLVNVRIKGIRRVALEQHIREHNVGHELALGLVRTDDEFIVIGRENAIMRLRTILEAQGVVCCEAPLAYVLHMLCCTEFARRMDTYLAKVDCKPPRYALIDHAGKLIVAGQPIIKSALTRFMYEPIDVPKIVQHVHACDHVVQIGPSFLTKTIIKSFLPHVRVTRVQRIKDIKGLQT